MVLDGTGDYVATSSGLADFRFGTGDFTIATTFEPSSAKHHVLAEFYSASAGSWLLFIRETTGAVEFWTHNGSVDVKLLDSGATVVLPAGGKKHIAVIRYAGTVKLYIDGSSVASTSDSTNYNNTVASVVSIGARVHLRNTSFDAHGRFDDVIITKEALYTSNFTPQHGLNYLLGRSSSPHVLGAASLLAEQAPHAIINITGPLQQTTALTDIELSGLLSITTPLGVAQLLAELNWLASCAAVTPLGANAVVALHDFYGFISANQRHLYTMQLQTSAGAVRVPISSWQATLHVEDASFVQAVVPAADQWVDELGDADSFVVFRRTTLVDGREIDAALASAPLQTLTFAQGGFNSTATLQGYLTDLALDPDASATPTLRDVQTVFTYADGIRVRCAIDWQLRPGMTCYYGTTPVVVEYINYYVTGQQAYMDVGGA